MIFVLFIYFTKLIFQDLWSSYLFKILVGKSVLNVTIDDKSGNVRMYAHCTNTKRSVFTKIGFYNITDLCFKSFYKDLISHPNATKVSLSFSQLFQRKTIKTVEVLK